MNLATDSPTNKLPARRISCVYCRQKKLRCEEERPCLHCRRLGLACTPRVPPTPQRRKKTPTAEQDPHKKIKSHENVIAENRLPLDISGEGDQEMEDGEVGGSAYIAAGRTPNTTGHRKVNSAYGRTKKCAKLRTLNSVMLT